MELTDATDRSSYDAEEAVRDDVGEAKVIAADSDCYEAWIAMRNLIICELPYLTRPLF